MSGLDILLVDSSRDMGDEDSRVTTCVDDDGSQRALGLFCDDLFRKTPIEVNLSRIE